MLARAEHAGLASWRAQALQPLRGRVLEIGGGTGLNLPHYPPGVELLVAEPDRHMRTRLLARADRSPVTVVDWSAEQLGAADSSCDAVVSTLVLCTVADPTQAVRELARVLRPGGRLVLIEHIVGATPRTRAAQALLGPLWRCCAGGCRLRRDPRAALAAHGFALDGLTEDALPAAPAFLRRALRGYALKPPT